MTPEERDRFKYLITCCKSAMPNIAVGGKLIRRTIIAAGEEMTALREKVDKLEYELYTLREVTGL